MKCKLFILAAAIAFTGCTLDGEIDSLESRKAYTQAFSDNKDCIFVNYADGWYPQRQSYGKTLPNGSKDSVQCQITVDSKLIVDGGTSSDISDTYVTVEKIIVRLWPDGQQEPVVCLPKTDKNVAEPSGILEWEGIPQGITYARKTLCEKPVSFSYKEYFYAEVEVFFMLRIKDNNQVSKCFSNRYSNTVKFGSTSYKEENMNVVVPLELTTVKVKATVDDWSNKK